LPHAPNPPLRGNLCRERELCWKSGRRRTMIHWAAIVAGWSDAMLRRVLFALPRALTTFAAIAFCAGTASADELLLKSGLTLRGNVVRMSGLDARTIGQNNNADVPAAVYWMCDDGVRRYFILRKNAPDVISDDRVRGVGFTLQHERRGSKGIPTTIGWYEKTEFDKFGRRLIELQTLRGTEQVHQAITLIRPEFLKVESTSHSWEFGLDVSTIPPESLREIIDQTIDPQRVGDRKAVVAFFIQIGRYAQAREEIERIAETFPEEAAWAEENRIEVQHLNALNALQEVRRRQIAGQYQLAYDFARAVPADRVSANVLREARDIIEELEGTKHRLSLARMQLDMLQAELDEQTAQRLAPLRAALLTELAVDSLPRLEPFIRAESDATLSAAEKLALAYSGWVVGSANAVTELDAAIRLWDARFLVMEYLRADGDPSVRTQLLDQLQKTEGVSLPRVLQMIEFLPPPLATPAIPPGEPTTLDVVDAWDQVQQKYSVSLPKEYSPQHVYPLLIVLHAGGMSPNQELSLWAGSADQPGPAQVRGYITIAPHYAEEGEKTYDYDSEAHAAVLECLNDARRRFRIDSDRVYLAGHGMGGDACFDMGMSHPGIFAGVAPVNGTSDRYCIYNRLNDPQVAWYVVAGELHGDKRGMAVTSNARDLNQMMRTGQDIIYCEYQNRGFETYFEEFGRIFDWFAVQRRAPPPRELGSTKRKNPGITVMRPFDTRFHWLEVEGLPARLSEPILWDSAPRRTPPQLHLTGNFTAGNEINTVYIEHPGSRAALWLSPDLIDFNKRVKVIKGSTVFFDFVQPQIGVMLEDLRVRGDRQRLYWGKVEF